MVVGRCSSFLLLVTTGNEFRKRHAFCARRDGFFGGNFLFRISEFRRSEKGYVHFANYRFSFRKLQILISQTTDFHFANYIFPFRFANYSKPKISSRQRKEGNCRLTGQNRKGLQKRKRLQEKASSLDESVKRMICQ